MMRQRKFSGMRLAIFGLMSLVPLLAAADEQSLAVSDSELSMQVVALRDDVRELRADLRRLLEHLNVDEDLSEVDDGGSSADVSTPGDNEPSDTSSLSEFAELTLDDCGQIALAKSKVELSDSERLVVLQNVHDAYWDLWSGYKAVEVQRAARDRCLGLWRLAASRNRPNSSVDDGMEAQVRTLYKQFESQIHAAMYGSSVPGSDALGLYGREIHLRKVIGWENADGRMIRPIDEPKTDLVEPDFDVLRDRALMNNPSLQSKRSQVEQCELELSKAQAQAQTEVLHIYDLAYTYSWLGVGDVPANANSDGTRPSKPGSHAIEETAVEDFQLFSELKNILPVRMGTRRIIANEQKARDELVKTNDMLRESEASLVNQLTNRYRSFEANANAMKDYRDQLQAVTHEVNTYQKQFDNKWPNQLTQLVDQLIRAEECRVRSATLYYSVVAENAKSIVDIERLKGSLGSNDGPFDPMIESARRARFTQKRALTNAICGLPSIVFASVTLGSLPSQIESEADTATTCKISVLGSLSTPISDEVSQQIATTASKLIAGLSLSDISVFDLNRLSSLSGK